MTVYVCFFSFVAYSNHFSQVFRFLATCFVYGPLTVNFVTYIYEL